MCGGSVRRQLAAQPPQGLSPRVRGKHRVVGAVGRDLRSIPACAGEAPMNGNERPRTEVYPRVCVGSVGRHHQPAVSQGLSPRVRGKRCCAAGRRCGGGSIPACAGEATVPAATARPRRVYPRVCGGSGLRVWTSGGNGGLSPRVRGKLVRVSAHGGNGGSIPACAGEAPAAPGTPAAAAVYPRVCGGSTYGKNPVYVVEGLSPRVRGKRG